ncbi:hypothetical protein [Arthrobacter woluwensis]|uniref:Uncharacterized protein n=1 Tax=Arthrobacter woluwensis TaxID=156980 RepID=A0A1H4R7P5_9MICC|nr:hypothetical protein [Arthrobacter woluwensis]SEC27883.1 hypothetical protein SAMN04489745_2482 [Arthrobacter woluwensis]
MSTAKVTCYIEEYHDQRGTSCARLRETGTDRQVRLSINGPAHRRQFLAFLSSTGALFSTYRRSDPIVISGVVISSTPQTLDFAYDDQIQYFID